MSIKYPKYSGWLEESAMKCEEGYVCEVCGNDVESPPERSRYLRYVRREVPLERLHLQHERHLRCNPILAQFIIDPRFEPVVCDGPFAKENYDPEYVLEQERRVTAAWRRLND